MPRISQRRAWAPPGMRPRSPRQIVREYTYVYAAVAPQEGKMTSLIPPTADTAMLNLLTFACRQDLRGRFHRDAGGSSGMASCQRSPGA